MTKLDKILNEIKKRNINTKDAKQKILDLFDVSGLFCRACKSENVIEYEIHHIRCLDCDSIYKK